jgi:hypothetical protein
MSLRLMWILWSLLLRVGFLSLLVGLCLLDGELKMQLGGRSWMFLFLVLFGSFSFFFGSLILVVVCLFL